ncbi:MAG: FAD-dependent oxidoreductase [Rhodobacteraceae bacterium]|nr:FAD-dependent oxidoreductase [Paracoccaceae bacterium]
MAQIAISNFDVVIIGGGVKGSAIARDAVGRGLRVLLCEQGDLGSSCVKNLARLGLEAFQAPKVCSLKEAREAVQEWSILRRISPHLAKARTNQEQSHWIKAILGRFRATQTAKVAPDVPLLTILSGHRFVMLNLRDAADRGAVILPRTQFQSAERRANRWFVSIRTGCDQIAEMLTSRILVDTTGGRSLPNGLLAGNAVSDAVISGTLAIVKTLGDDPNQVLEVREGTRFFSVPLETGCQLIGQLRDGPEAGRLADLTDQAKRLCGGELDLENLLWQGQTTIPSSGLAESPTRGGDDFHIHIQTDEGHLPLFQITGGTVSGARRLAEDTVAEMAPYANMIGKKWTGTTTLPGGDFQPNLRDTLVAQLQADYAFLSAQNVERLFDTYGTDCNRLLGDAKSEADLGQRFSEELYATEVRWLVQNEWARTAGDIVWRRTRLGQRMTGQQIRMLDLWLAGNSGSDGTQSPRM